MKLQKVIRGGDLWVCVIDDDGKYVHEELLREAEGVPIQPDFELPVEEEEKRKLSKRGKFTIAAIAGGALVTAVIVVRRHNHRERA